MNATMNTTAISIWAFGLTDIGMLRKTNGDSVLIADLANNDDDALTELRTDQLGDRGALFVLADGMGGEIAGEIASSMAVTTLRDELVHGDARRASSEQLRQITKHVNSRIWHHSQFNPELDGMGTTITALLVRDGIAYISQVGDSRAYLIRGRRIEQLTKDQSLVQKMLDSGLLTPEEAARHPGRNVILQALGVKPSVEVALTTVKLHRNDQLLICSDGLSNKVTPEEMQRAVTESESPEYACHWLIELANVRGGEDNIAVIIARFAGEALFEGDEEVSAAGLSDLAKVA